MLTDTGAAMRGELKRRCDAIEEAYEFMLAYAAQGLPGDSGSESNRIRSVLTRAADALVDMATLVVTIAERDERQPAGIYRTFADTLQRDADTARTILLLVLNQPSISSELIDSVNA